MDGPIHLHTHFDFRVSNSRGVFKIRDGIAHAALYLFSHVVNLDVTGLNWSSRSERKSL